MDVIVKEGKELEEVLDLICEENNISRNDFYYSYENKKNGLFNKNSIEVKVILKTDLINYIKDYLNELLTNMGLSVTMESKLREDTMYIKIFSDHNSILIGRDGNTLKAIEHIVKQKVKTEFNIYPYINLDVENYKEKKEKRLEYMAKKIAREVKQTNVAVELDNMNAYDRRIVHNALSNIEGISSESVGEEPNRHIVIKPL